jgi:hypothetical protein
MPSTVSLTTPTTTLIKNGLTEVEKKLHIDAAALSGETIKITTNKTDPMAKQVADLTGAMHQATWNLVDHVDGVSWVGKNFVKYVQAPGLGITLKYILDVGTEG